MNHSQFSMLIHYIKWEQSFYNNKMRPFWGSSYRISPDDKKQWDESCAIEIVFSSVQKKDTKEGPQRMSEGQVQWCIYLKTIGGGSNWRQ